ncbi:putative inorganic carbon transporter subunit DabA [Phycicoccus ginsengisoli]
MSWSWSTPPRLLALLAAALGLAALGPATAGRPWSGALGPVEGAAWPWRLDVTASLLLVFVGVLTWLVARFCAVNLRGRGRGRDVGILLIAVLLSLGVMAASASIIGFAAGWTTSGLLVTVLIARAGTPRAGTAAAGMRRWLLVGDAALWAGVGLWAWWFPTTQRGSLATPTTGWQATVVAALLAVACLARSGLVPAHRWLPETAEAPSPVSALLHAGVVNGAGLLGVAAWPVFAASPAVLACLLGAGLLTVVVGAWAGTVRRDVKGRLAWSTTTQMGYMVVQLGLGLPGMAFMHLIAHGCYKSWLFLRAGGSPERHRHRWATSRRPLPRLAGALGAVALLGAAGAPAAAGVLSSSGPTAVVPLLVAATAVALAGWAAAGQQRASLPVVLGVVALAGAAGVAYTWLLRGWEVLVSAALAAPPVWGPVAAAVLTGACAAAGLVLVRGRSALARSVASPLALRLLPLSLSPGRTPRGTVPDLLLSATRRAVTVEPTGLDRSRLEAAAGRAAATTGPAWPVGAMVAANPLSALESVPFADAVAAAEQAHGSRVLPALGRYVALHESGRITEAHLDRALQDHPDLPPTAAALVAETRQLLARPKAGAVPRQHRRLREVLATGSPRRAQLALEHEGVWTQLAWSDSAGPVGATAPRGARRPDGPYALWRTAAAQRGYDRVTGIRGASAWVRSLPEDPAAAILALATVLGIDEPALEDHLRATATDGPGWTAHAMWRCRETGRTTPLLELLALRLAHDVLFCWEAATAQDDPRWDGAARGAVRAPARVADADRLAGAVRARELALGMAWQRALEAGVQDWLLDTIDHARPLGAARTGATPSRPASQSLWCIDVRSERIRRHLESIGRHETFGVAGFFGGAVRLTDADGNVEDLCPILLQPDHVAGVGTRTLRLREAVHRTATSVSRHPIAALAVAEGGGFLSGATSLASTLRPAVTRRAVRTSTAHGARAVARELRHSPLATDLTLHERADLAHGALLAVGLVSDFAPVLLVCGHGATVENNAFAAAYDCGACGGHPGVVNAVLLAQVLNEPEVRAELALRGVHLPDDTVAVAALHDTTTDRVELLGPVEDPELVRDLEVAGARAAHERLRTLPRRRRGETPGALPARAADWSEPAPEWGLAGNAALVIGPRSLTRGAGLDGRVFLHSYDERVDPERTVLEQLLTAPLVVAQWINAQYYFSTAAPHLYGAGDKTTHNVVGDVGVLTGARGDLRTGLPWQTLSRSEPADAGPAHDPVRDLVHEPVRLTVVVAAPPQAVAAIVERHQELRRLVANDWITLLVATPEGRYLALGPDLQWRHRTTGRSTPAPHSPAGPSRTASTTPAGPSRTPSTTPAGPPAPEVTDAPTPASNRRIRTSTTQESS